MSFFEFAVTSCSISANPLCPTFFPKNELWLTFQLSILQTPTYILVYFHSEFCPRSSSRWPAAHIHIPVVFWLEGLDKSFLPSPSLISAPCSGNSQLGCWCNWLHTEGATVTLRTDQRGCTSQSCSPTPLPHPNPLDQISFHSRSRDSFSGPGLSEELRAV